MSESGSEAEKVKTRANGAHGQHHRDGMGGGGAAAGDHDGAVSEDGVELVGGKNKKNDMEDAKGEIEGFDWEGLEGRFWERMEECRRVEEGVVGEFRELVEVGLFLF